MPLCCQIRTGVLFIGFFLGFSEVTTWVFYYTWRPEVRAALGLGPEDPDFELTVLSVVVIVDLVVNILLISGANKDYSGRRKDLRSLFLLDFLPIMHFEQQQQKTLSFFDLKATNCEIN